MHVVSDKPKRLNVRQQKFVEAYMALGNATKAADIAGYKHAHVQAFRLLENICVKAEIEAIRAHMSKD